MKQERLHYNMRLLAVWFCVLAIGLVEGRAKEPLDAIDPVELHTKSGGRVWVYMPSNISSGSKVACVLAPPAGSRFFHWGKGSVRAYVQEGV